MAIVLYKPDGTEHIEFHPKVVSTAFAFNDLVYLDGNGYLTPAVDGSLIKPLGLIKKTIATTDSDYATATRVPVEVAGVNSVYLCDVSTGSAAITDVGEHIDIDDANSVDVAASTYDIFFVTDIISATQVLAKLNIKSGAAA